LRSNRRIGEWARKKKKRKKNEEGKRISYIRGKGRNEEITSKSNLNQKDETQNFQIFEEKGKPSTARNAEKQENMRQNARKLRFFSFVNHYSLKSLKLSSRQDVSGIVFRLLILQELSR
jgi:hypothetical protein